MEIEALNELIAVCLVASGAESAWEPAIRRGRMAGVTGFLIVGGVRESYPAAFDDWEAEGVIRGFHTECDLDGLVADHCPQDFLLMSEPVLLPPDAAAPARRYIMADSRVCSVSFLSNAAGALSFPFRSTPNPYPIPGKTEFEVTQALRTDTNSEPVPISLPWGAVNLINSSCMDVLGGLRSARGHQVDQSSTVLGLRLPGEASGRSSTPARTSTTRRTCACGLRWTAMATLTSPLDGLDH